MLVHLSLVSLQIRFFLQELPAWISRFANKHHNLTKSYPPFIFLSRNLFGTSSRELVNQCVNLRIKILISDPKLQNEEVKKVYRKVEYGWMMYQVIADGLGYGKSEQLLIYLSGRSWMVDGINTSITTCKTRELNLRDSSVFWLPFKSTHLPKKGLKKKNSRKS